MVTTPELRANGEYAAVVQRAADTGTIEQFLRDYRARYPDALPASLVEMTAARLVKVAAALSA